MHRVVRMSAVVLALACAPALSGLLAIRPVLAQEQEKFTNLKVFPKDVSPQELRSTMSSFTRALGVRCNFCHALPEGRPIKHDDWASDDKPEKLKARAMMEMTRDLNDKYLAALEHRSDPPVRIQCFTCHRGVKEPRTLQDVMKQAYAQGGLDTTRARYARLRDRYYGRAAYDFGDVPLADVGASLADSGRVKDAVGLLAFNVEMNPQSAFAQRQYAAGSVVLAYTEQGGDSGGAVYQRVKAQLGQPRETEGILDGIGHRLLKGGKTEAAIAAFKLNTTEHPTSGDAFESLGEVYLKQGEKKLAIESYLKAVGLDSTNTNAVQQLEALKVSKKKIASARERR